MAAPINPTQLTPPRVEFIDPRTGAISREWYRFFLSLLTATQTNQQETELAPDTSSLMATYDAMLADLTQSTESAPDCCSEAANVDAKVNSLTQAVGVTPPAASEDEIAVIQSELQALALLPPPQPAPVAAAAAGVTSVAALTLGTTGTDLSSTVANSTTTPVITLNVPTASNTNRGVLSPADWNTFNSKQAPLTSGSNIRTINGNSLLGGGNLLPSDIVPGFWAATVARLTGTQASSVIALGNVTQLVGAIVANAVYVVDCFVTFQSAATTTGLNLGFTSPAGTVCQLEVVVPITSTAAATQLRTIFPNAAATNTGNVLGTGVTAMNSNHTARISGLVICGATPGNFQVQFASEIAGSAVTLQTGSSLVMQRIA